MTREGVGAMNEMGPNVRRLFIHRMSVLTIPAGGGFADGLAFFTDQEKRRSIMREAEIWVAGAIQTVRTASGPNPWREADDETIAGEIMRQAEERKS